MLSLACRRVYAVAALTALLAACGTRPVLNPGRDGPAAVIPSGLERTPDAEPRIEPLRSGGPNKPYEVLGESYTPLTSDRALRESGLASWYGRKFHGKPTSSGELYDMYAMTAAHKTMPIPSYARVRNPANGREVIVRVNDRGPFAAGRVIDLSYTAALKLGLLGGVAPVTVERITHDEIRAGLWRRDRTLPEPEGAAVEDPLMALVNATASVSAVSSVSPVPPAPPVSTAPPPVPASGYWVQLGAFRQREGAAALQQRVQRESAGLPVSVFDDRTTFRVQSGPFASRAEALGIAERLRGLLALNPLLVERP